MATIKATYFMAVGRFAWTESHWINGFEALAEAESAAIRLGKKRAALFGTDTSMTAIRLSAENVNRDSYLIDTSKVPGNQLALVGNAGAAADNSTDVEDVALIVRAESGVLHRKSVYVRGNPDIVEGNRYAPGKLDFGNADYQAAFKQYVNELVGTWGFWGRDTTKPEVIVRDIVADGAPPKYFGPVITAGDATYAVGDFVQLKGFSVVKGATPVNGIYQVAGPIPGVSGGFQTYFLRNTIGINPASITKMGKVQLVAKNFLLYSRILPRYVKRRATGGRTGLPLGRRKIRR